MPLWALALLVPSCNLYIGGDNGFLVYNSSPRTSFVSFHSSLIHLSCFWSSRATAMNPHESPIPPQNPYEIPSMNPKYCTPHHVHQQTGMMSKNEQLTHAVSNILVQRKIKHSRIIKWFLHMIHSPGQTQKSDQSRSQAYQQSMSWCGWTSFENVASYHQWDNRRMTLEVRTLLENVVAQSCFRNLPSRLRSCWRNLPNLCCISKMLSFGERTNSTEGHRNVSSRNHWTFIK